jgi:hypothetical protein
MVCSSHAGYTPIDESAMPTWGDAITLNDARTLLAIMQIEEVYHYDLQREARLKLALPIPSTRWFQRWCAGVRCMSPAR